MEIPALIPQTPAIRRAETATLTPLTIMATGCIIADRRIIIPTTIIIRTIIITVSLTATAITIITILLETVIIIATQAVADHSVQVAEVADSVAVVEAQAVVAHAAHTDNLNGFLYPFRFLNKPFVSRLIR